MNIPLCRSCDKECKEGALFEEYERGVPDRWIIFFCEDHMKTVVPDLFVRAISPEEAMVMTSMDYAYIITLEVEHSESWENVEHLL